MVFHTADHVEYSIRMVSSHIVSETFEVSQVIVVPVPQTVPVGVSSVSLATLGAVESAVEDIY